MRSSTPKVLHDLCGAPMVLWPVRAALAAGAAHVVVVDSPARALEQVLPQGVELAVQPRPDGTGGAVAAALAQLDAGGAPVEGTVIVLSGDVPLLDAETIDGLAQAHAPSGAAATIVTSILEDASGYGRVVRDETGAVLRVVETKKAGDASDAELQILEVNAGIYAFDAGALRDALPRLSAENAQRELYLPQALDVLRADGKTVAAHVLDDPAAMLGVNDRVALAHVRKLAQRAINERHMRAGVDIVDPDATVIDAGRADRRGHDDRAVHDDPRRDADRSGLHDQALLSGRLRSGGRCERRPVRVPAPGHDRCARASKVGTFVELKNSDLGAGAKVPHLSYIGDADVGEGSNLGAATITANYDGQKKHRTTIGKRVHGGVDTSFVAPVTVGDDAYTAAGSVVTDDVPAGALAVARAKQRNVEGYAERRDASVTL